MTAPGLLDFFVLEASEYLEQLDGLLAGGSTAPDFAALQRAARSLRGSATMAKLAPFAEVATALERVARAGREGSLPFDRALGGALVSAVDDLKVLLHAARTWGDAETERARARTMELLTRLPADAAPAATPAGTGSIPFLANETANVAAGIEFLLTAPGGGGDAGIQVLQRIRALRGIAAIRDVAALPDALEGAEQAAAPLEAGRPLADAQRKVLRHAATLLRELAQAIRSGRGVAQDHVDAVEQALDQWLDQEEGAGDPVVPISSLFHGDDGPHVVTATPNPPTTAAQRFRLEMVSNGEHLRLIVAEAQSADPAARERYRRHARRALRSIRRSADSFGERAVAEALDMVAADLTTVDDAALARLTLVARRLAAPFGDAAQLAASIRDAVTGASSRPTPLQPIQAVAPVQGAHAQPQPQPQAQSQPQSPAQPAPTPPAPLPSAAPPAAPPVHAAPPVQQAAPLRMTPRQHDFASMLERSATAVASIAAQPLAAPRAVTDAPVVPIETILYRGKAALHRALELRDEMREAGATPARESVEELFDLIELALVD